MRFRVVCLLLTTSGEVVSFLFRITKKEIYMTKEEFVSYIFDKTVEMYAATYGSCNPLNKPEGKDDFGFAPIFPDICYHLTHYRP
ncbi:hypothetical protein FSG60_024775, partial [Escherichia coli]|nr:hypothetical protein [Escherichia coli]